MRSFTSGFIVAIWFVMTFILWGVYGSEREPPLCGDWRTHHLTLPH